MARKPLYKEGAETLNISLPIGVKAAIQDAAQEERQSASQLIAIILEEWLARRTEREAVPA